MCTVTIIPLSAGVRLACNRDELRPRPAALPPVVRRYGEREAALPIDPVSNGTWIAVNDAGLVATLLNVNLQQPRRRDVRLGSRGELVPRLMGCATLDEADAMGTAVDALAYPPFRLVVLDERALVDFYSDGTTLRRCRSLVAQQPHLFTSSGLGDALVEGPRRALFEQMFTSGVDWVTVQDAFHRHAWPDRRHLSVCMARAEARTVSHTVIELTPTGAVLTYYPDAPDHAQPLAPLALPRRRISA